MEAITRQNRSIWKQTLFCFVASFVFWLLFKGRDSYPDFQALIPIILWFLLMAVHFVLGSITISRAWKSSHRFRYALVFIYFFGSLFVHLTLLFDYNGWDENLYVEIQDVLHPNDLRLHRALDQDAIDLAEIRKLLGSGANADSWRGTWAIWKAYGSENQQVLDMLLGQGARPDRKSRSGTSHKNFKYRIDGPLERLIVRRDKRETMLCSVLAKRSEARQDSGSLKTMESLLVAGANSSQLCKGWPPGSTLYIAAIRNDAAGLKLLQKYGGASHNQSEVDEIAERFRWAASRNVTDLLEELIKLLPIQNHQSTYDMALWEAVNAGQTEVSLKMIELGARPRQAGLIPLAIRNSEAPLKLVARLIDAGADPDVKDSSGKSPIALALTSKNLPLLRTLLKLGADVNRPGIRYGALHATYKIGHPDRLEFAKIILAAGADLEQRNQNDNSFLMSAVHRNDLQSVQYALKNGADLQATNNKGLNANALAIQSQASDEILSLLNVRKVSTPATVEQLIAAVKSRSLKQVILQIEAGSPVNGSNSSGLTPLEAAMRKKRPEIYSELLRRGADPNCMVRNGSPLESVTQLYTLQRLRKARGLKKTDELSIPILSAAAMSGDVLLVDTLLQAGANPNANSLTGETALHLIALQLKDYADVVHSLVNAGINTDTHNQDGYTAATLAAKNRSIKFISALYESDVDINLKDANGRTAIGEAIRNGGVRDIIFQLLQMNAIPNKSDLEYAEKNMSPAGMAQLRAAVSAS